MCNPTDNLVRYTLPYKVVDGCLCQETTKRNKPTTEKLCNFTAYIVNEVLFDDGVGTSRTMRIGGVHASGRKLPEIEVTANEFKKMDWVLERWGADCIIEPVPRAAERICAAIQSTATFENTKDVYYKTGWKNIDGKWDYLLPGAGKHDVRLFGKLSRYEMAKDWSKSDLQTVWLMMKDKLIATKAILDFMYVNEIIDKTEEELVIDEFREILYGLANRQSKTIQQDKPAVIFIQKLYSLIDSEQAVVLDRTVFNDYRPANFIGYEDDEFYCLNSDLAHRAVYQLCKSQGESFTIKKNELIKALAYEGLLDSDKGKNVKSVNVCGKGSMKLLCIIKEKANKIAASAE